MSRENFRKTVTNSRPYLSEDYNYPKFKKGEVVWFLKERDAKAAEYHSLRYECIKSIVISGEPHDDDCGWYYRICPLNKYESKDYNSIDNIDELQTCLFSTLRELKDAVKYKCDKRIDKLKEKIELIEMQKEDIELEFDEQENRDEKIDNILEND